MENNFYTKLTYEVKMPDEERSYKASFEEPEWDLTGEQIMSLFYKIWIAAGYSSDSFTRHCENWVKENKK